MPIQLAAYVAIGIDDDRWELLLSSRNVTDGKDIIGCSHGRNRCTAQGPGW